MTAATPAPPFSNNPINNPANVAMGEETQIEAYNAVANALTTEDAQRKLLGKIDQVAASVNSIRTTFRTILASLREVASVATIRKSEFHALVVDWEDHFRTFESCIFKSRCVAARACTIAEDFAGEIFDVLNDRSGSLDVKRLILAEHDTRLNLVDEAADELDHRFDALDCDLDGFSMEWRDLCRTIDSDEYQAQSDVVEQQKIVDDVKRKSNLAKMKIREPSMNSRGFGVAVTVGVKFCPVTIPTTLTVPGAGVGAFLTAHLGIAFGTASSDTKSLDEQLKAMNTELGRKLLASTYASNTLVAALSKKNLDFRIFKDIGLLSDIWSMVSADISTLQERVDLVQSQTIETLFYRRLGATIPLYVSLAGALKKYAHAIPDRHRQ